MNYNSKTRSRGVMDRAACYQLSHPCLLRALKFVRFKDCKLLMSNNRNKGHPMPLPLKKKNLCHCSFVQLSLRQVETRQIQQLFIRCFKRLDQKVSIQHEFQFYKVNFKKDKTQISMYVTTLLPFTESLSCRTV